jgi:pSer/pThr/pTyr-binding forkhead associated (FHA) protein
MLDRSLHDLDIQLTVQDETLGRSDDNSICIKYNKVSRNHARISFENNKWVIEDLNSANGVYINEQAIDKSAMGQGDIVVIGQVPFRFEVINTPLGMESEDKQTATEDEYVGDSGTMYAQHVGVIESLANNGDSKENDSEDLPPPVHKAASTPSASAAQQPQKKSKSALKILLTLSLVPMFVASYFFWQKGQQSNELDKLQRAYSKNVQLFIENYEGNNTKAAGISLNQELDKINKITARVDVSLSQHKAHEGLKQLKQQLTFLSFERNLLILLDNNSFFEADRLVQSTRQDISAITITEAAKKQNYEGLLDLSETAILFKRFSDQYPAPTSQQAISKKPDNYELRKMLDVKETFIRHKKNNYLLLSVTYSKLHKLLEQVEENDIRILNRWQEVIKRNNT